MKNICLELAVSVSSIDLTTEHLGCNENILWDLEETIEVVHLL